MKLKPLKTYWIKHNTPFYQYKKGVEQEIIMERAILATVESYQDNLYILLVMGWDGTDTLPEKCLLDAVEVLCPWDNTRID